MKTLFNKIIFNKIIIATGILAGSLALGSCEKKEELKEIVQEAKSPCLYSTDLRDNCKALHDSYSNFEKSKDRHIEVSLGKESPSLKNTGIYYSANSSCLQKINELPFIESFYESPNSFFLGTKDVSVRFEDFNNDDKMDILASGVTKEKRDSVEFYVLTNLGNESFSKPQKVGAVYLPASGEIVVVTDDYNKDGFKDIGCRTFSNDSPSYSVSYDLINKKNNSFESKITHKGYLNWLGKRQNKK